MNLTKEEQKVLMYALCLCRTFAGTKNSDNPEEGWIVDEKKVEALTKLMDKVKTILEIDDSQEGFYGHSLNDAVEEMMKN